METVLSHENIRLHDIVVCRLENKLSTELDDETVILDIDSGNYSGLNSVGSAIWRMLEKPVTFEEIVQVVLGNYDVSQSRCVNDVLEFLNSLIKNKLVVIRDGKNL